MDVELLLYSIMCVWQGDLLWTPRRALPNESLNTMATHSYYTCIDQVAFSLAYGQSLAVVRVGDIHALCGQDNRKGLSVREGEELRQPSINSIYLATNKMKNMTT
jgi:hypothetical protein